MKSLIRSISSREWESNERKKNSSQNFIGVCLWIFPWKINTKPEITRNKTSQIFFDLFTFLKNVSFSMPKFEKKKPLNTHTPQRWWDGTKRCDKNSPSQISSLRFYKTDDEKKKKTTNDLLTEWEQTGQRWLKIDARPLTDCFDLIV